jgi:hypothetical protein
MATGAGPLCEEPMWGVALELEARMCLTSRAAPGASDTAAGEGWVVELQEDVYGPFSGQVGLIIGRELSTADDWQGRGTQTPITLFA